MTDDLDDEEMVARLLDAYAERAYRRDVAAVDPDENGVPLEMRAGDVDDEGWVEWQLLPSTLTSTDVTALEIEFNVAFPPLFRTYLTSRFHVFDQVRSQRYNQLIFLTATPSHQPLKPLRELLRAWRPLISADFVPFSQWGDGWGPMCFDVRHRGIDGDCPIVWMDHELLIPLGADGWGTRERLKALVNPLYVSFREFLADVFVPRTRNANSSHAEE